MQYTNVYSSGSVQCQQQIVLDYTQYKGIMQTEEREMNFTRLVRQHPSYADSEILKKEHKHPQFKKEMAQIQSNYLQQLNMALYACLEVQEGCCAFETHHTPDRLYVSFYACRMPPVQSSADKFYLLWIRQLDEQLRQSLGKKYVIIYFHSLADSVFPYNFLKDIFKKLPLFYYAMLDKIYVVELSPILRSMVSLFDFGRLHKLFIRKIQHIDTILQLSTIPQIKHSHLLNRLPPFFKWQQKQPTPQLLRKPPTGPKDYLVRELANHKLTKDGYPLTLTILFQTLKSHPHLLQVQGIFRKSGSIDQEQEIIQQLQQMNEVRVVQNIDEDSGYALAAVVKKFFTRLSTPIIPYSLYTKLLAQMGASSIKQEEEVFFVQGFMMELPKLNQKTIFHLIRFLKDSVVTRSDKNLMTSKNLSVCLGPCFFRSESPSYEDLFNIGRFAGIILLMFNRFDEIFTEERRSRGSNGSNGHKGSRYSQRIS